MSSGATFRPTWTSAPGETILDILRDRGISVDEFTESLGESRPNVDSLLQGRATITLALARRLKRILGPSVAFWMSRDFHYREDISRFHKEEKAWLRELPVGDMIKFGWLDPVPRPVDEYAACLRFFDVPSIDAWRRKYSDIQASAAFKTSASLDSQPAAVAAWLRQGEIEAQSEHCQPWDPAKFAHALIGVRKLTKEKKPAIFLSKLKDICRECGVAIVVLRSPTGCRASGATRFISDTKALLLLSFRYLSDDHFWFTFFHEAGHLLLHGRDRLFIEDASKAKAESSKRSKVADLFPAPDDTGSLVEEREANRFAADSLIPPAHQISMSGLPLEPRAIIRFALRVGVSPGIVVGQLQHLGRVKHDRLNRLKRRFVWAPQVRS